jgi:hypothetical protein
MGPISPHKNNYSIRKIFFRFHTKNYNMLTRIRNRPGQVKGVAICNHVSHIINITEKPSPWLYRIIDTERKSITGSDQSVSTRTESDTMGRIADTTGQRKKGYQEKKGYSF